MISQLTINRVRDRVVTREVLEDFIELKRAGANWLCCCPFHEERTPSFSVNDRSNLYHCFGCGESGDGLSFLMNHEGMSFPDAVKYLAKKYNIQVEEETKVLSEQEKTRAILQENGLAALKQVQAYFESCFTSENATAKKVREYASNRWGFDFCREQGIGYAPFPSDFFNWVKGHNVAMETLRELGIVNTKEDGRDSFMFCNRVTIPIRDRWGRVVGFTARTLDKDCGSKYLNSKNSAVYKKGDFLFGLDVAKRAGSKSKLLYVVEGAPDVLRFQALGLDNAVAALGTSWGADQFKTIAAICTNLCFIPDSEAPKTDQGQVLGPGFEAVMRNGKLAVEQGFHVTVKEIPLAEGEEKQDADSYLDCADKLHSLEEKDFVLWYAEKAFLKATTNIGRSEAIKDICSILAALDDETLASMFLDQLGKQYKEKQSWKLAYNQAKSNRRNEQSDKAPKNSERDLYSRYGFFIANNCYCNYGKDGDVNRLSNFVLTPMYAIPDQGSMIRLYKIVNSEGQEAILPLDPDEHVNIALFRKRLNIAGNYVWLGKIDDLQRVEEYIYKRSGEAKRIRTLGWQQDGFFAYGDGVFTDHFIHSDELGMVKLPNFGTYYLPAFSVMYRDNSLKYSFEKSFTYTHRADVDLGEYLRLFTEVFGDNGKVGISFIFATLFRDIIFGMHEMFPIFSIYGKPQSGKSQLGKAMKGFFTASYKPINYEGETYPAINRALEQTANCPVHFDEYKNSIEWRKVELLKSMWDGVGRGKMKDGDVERVNVNCGVILSGQEMPTIDPALFTRIVLVTVNKTSYTLEERRRFGELMELNRQGVCHLTMQIVKHRERFVEDFPHYCELTRNEVVAKVAKSRKNISDRMYMNWVVLLASYRTMERILHSEGVKLPFCYDELLAVGTEMLFEQHEIFSRGDEVGSFWEAVSVFFQESKIFEEGDFRIVHNVQRLKLYNGPERAFSVPTTILLLRDRRILQLYQQEKSRQTKQLVLGSDMMRDYLKRSSPYLGTVRRKFYKMNPFGVPEKESTAIGGSGRQKYVLDTALAFDYEQVKKLFNISLTADTDDLTEEEKAETQKNNPLGTQENDSLPF